MVRLFHQLHNSQDCSDFICPLADNKCGNVVRILTEPATPDGPLTILQLYFSVRNHRMKRHVAKLSPSATSVHFAEYLQPNAPSDQFGAKRLQIERLESYRMVCISTIFVKNWPGYSEFSDSHCANQNESAELQKCLDFKASRTSFNE